MVNYSKLKDRPYPMQTIKEPIVKRYGKETSIYKEIQSQVDDTDLYKCMEKYHTIEEGCEEVLEKIKNNAKGFFADVTEIQAQDNEKLDIFAQQEKIKELWASLPIEIRKEANFNIEELPNVAQKYINKQIELEKEKQAKIELEKQKELEKEKQAKIELEKQKQIKNMKGE